LSIKIFRIIVFYTLLPILIKERCPLDKEIFVQNVKYLCLKRGVKPTNACKESGVGGSFISDINRGRVPSVASVQMLAQYLGVTTSELLGESEIKDRVSELDAQREAWMDDEEQMLVLAYRKADEDAREIVRRALKRYLPASTTQREGEKMA